MNIFLRSSWLAFPDFFIIYIIFSSKDWKGLILLKLQCCQYLGKKGSKIGHFVFFLKKMSPDFPENSLEGEFLWQLTSFPKSYICQNSSSWVNAQDALHRSDSMIPECWISHDWLIRAANITQGGPRYYHFSACNKGKFYLVNIGDKLVKVKTVQVKEKLISLLASTGNTYFCSDLSFFNNFDSLLWIAAFTPVV